LPNAEIIRGLTQACNELGYECRSFARLSNRWEAEEMNDPIVEEVRRIRETHADRFNFDLDAIIEDLKRLEKVNGRPLTDLEPNIKLGKSELKLLRIDYKPRAIMEHS
jgi:hypothetical protein